MCNKGNMQMLQQRQSATDVAKTKGKCIVFVIQLRSCTTERVLTAAMLSDAADEAAMLTRAFDTEATDTARVPEELSMFVHRVRVLFLERQAINHGFTKLMMQQLGQVQNLLLQTFESKLFPATRMS